MSDMPAEAKTLIPPKPSKIGGNRKPPNAGKGRPKGAANKSTVAVKAAMQAVYADLQDAPAEGLEPGPHAHFKAWASANPTEFYKLWVKMLPTEISGPDGAPIAFQAHADELASLPADQRARVRAAIAAALEGKTG